MGARREVARCRGFADAIGSHQSLLPDGWERIVSAMGARRRLHILPIRHTRIRSHRLCDLRHKLAL